MDNSVVKVFLHTAEERADCSPGMWHLHCHSHLQPGFEAKLKRLDIAPAIHLPANWFRYLEQICTGLFNILAEYSQKRCFHKEQRTQLVLRLALLDIRNKTGSRLKFLQTLEALCQLEITDLLQDQLMDKLRYMSWLAPKLESSSFSKIKALEDCKGIVHLDIASKVQAVEQFYTELYTLHPSDASTKEAASILLGAVSNKLSVQSKHLLKAQFTVKELGNALSWANDSSAPGLDSITFALMKAMSGDLLHALCGLANCLLEGQPLLDREPAY